MITSHAGEGVYLTVRISVIGYAGWHVDMSDRGRKHMSSGTASELL